MGIDLRLNGTGTTLATMTARTTAPPERRARAIPEPFLGPFRGPFFLWSVYLWRLLTCLF